MQRMKWMCLALLCSGCVASSPEALGKTFAAEQPPRLVIKPFVAPFTDITYDDYREAPDTTYLHVAKAENPQLWLDTGRFNRRVASEISSLAADEILAMRLGGPAPKRTVSVCGAQAMRLVLDDGQTAGGHTLGELRCWKVISVAGDERFWTTPSVWKTRVEASSRACAKQACAGAVRAFKTALSRVGASRPWLGLSCQETPDGQTLDLDLSRCLDAPLDFESAGEVALQIEPPRRAR